MKMKCLKPFCLDKICDKAVTPLPAAMPQTARSPIIVGATHVKNMMRTARTHTIKNRATAAAVAFASILAVFLRFVGRRDLVACAVCGVFALT